MSPSLPVVTTAEVDALLPQTQCTRCGYPDCCAYAQAIAEQQAPINRCPPGGAEGIQRLALLTRREAPPLDPACGSEAPRTLAVIDEDWCIGCTLCIKACPLDCIVGSHKQMHTVIEDQCNGCELCLPVCPVDCISLVIATPGHTGWAAWSTAQADLSRERYAARNERRARADEEHAEQLETKARHKLEHLNELTRDNNPAELDRKRSVIEAALARARAARAK
ncbi:MAG: RnfABCDGE type electron transport complex subunit B [Burkholderiales bacterium]